MLLLPAHRSTARAALADAIVDAIDPKDQMLDIALELAQKRAIRAKTRVYSVLRNKVYRDTTGGACVDQLRATIRPRIGRPLVKIEAAFI